MAEPAGQQFLTRLPMLILLLLVVSLILHMVCLISSRWYTGNNGEAGLWKLCTITPPTCHHDVQHLNGRQGISAALMVIALGSLLMGTVCSVLHNFLKKMDKYLKLQILGLFLAAAAILLAIILWGSSVGTLQETLGGDVSLGWTFFFTMTVVLITAIGGFMAVLAFCFRNSATQREGTSNQSQPNVGENPPRYSDLNCTESPDQPQSEQNQDQQTGRSIHTGSPERSSVFKDKEGDDLNVRKSEQVPSSQKETTTDEQNKFENRDKAINRAEGSVDKTAAPGFMDTKEEKINTDVRSTEETMTLENPSQTVKSEDSTNKSGTVSDSGTGKEHAEKINEEFSHFGNSRHITNRDMASTLVDDGSHKAKTEDDDTNIHIADTGRAENKMSPAVETTAQDANTDSGPVIFSDLSKQSKMGMEAPRDSQQDSTTNETGQNRKDEEKQLYDERYESCEPEHVNGASK